jgi:hypothetical protein
MGDGRSTSFWKDRWRSDIPFCDLFLISTQKDSSVVEVCSSLEGERRWSFLQRRDLFVWEVELHWCWGRERDEWCWRPRGGRFFAWTMLLDRIPTRVHLASRGVLNVEASNNCVLCGKVEETTLHLFFCEVVLKVWQRVMCWLQFNFLIPHNLFAHFECWYYEATSRRIRRGFCLIWLASIWVIWKRMNEVIFNNGVVEIEDLVENIKVLAWYWSICKLKIATCLYYKWCWNPRIVYLDRIGSCFGVFWGCCCRIGAAAVLQLVCTQFGCFLGRFSASAAAAAGRCYMGWATGVLHSAVMFWRCGFVRHLIFLCQI